MEYPLISSKQTQRALCHLASKFIEDSGNLYKETTYGIQIMLISSWKKFMGE